LSTFKENVPDTRNSRVIDIVRELQTFGISVQIADPLANTQAVEEEYGLALTGLGVLRPTDAVVLAVAHNSYIEGGWPLVRGLLRDGTGLVLDVKARLDRGSVPDGIELWRL